MSNHWLGVDTGGTFTDFVYFDGDSIRIHKVLSTPAAPEQAILQGLTELNVSLDSLQVIHGSTVATNAVLEGKGVKTAYIANTGFADVLTIGRQARRELYNLMPQPHFPLVPEKCCIEINTRLSAKGELLNEVSPQDINILLSDIEKIEPQAIAINLLFSFLDDRQEQEIKECLLEHFKGIFVCCSSDVLPEYKEYERGVATVLNAYVGPLMDGYLNRLSLGLGKLAENEAVKPCLSVLQSSGGTIQAVQAGKQAVNLLLSGPAGGLMGAQYVAGLSGESRLLSFDMGGTSTDVALIDGEIKLTSEGSIGNYPVAVPMVDMHTIGAGGGSIAFVDAGGLLNVGPESAGAYPGPACYGQGGVQATVTDANLVLGRLQADGFLGEGMRLDVGAAQEALQKIADQLGITVKAAAEGVVRIANEHMVRALRTISVQRGFDPRDFSLTCFGGAGGLHVCALADALNMQRAIVPIHGGVLSALGMLVAAPSRELSHSSIQDLLSSDKQQLDKLFNELELKGVSELQEETAGKLKIQRSFDLRYQGQSFTLNLPWASDLKMLESAFNKLHKATYGHELDMRVELVSLRASIKGAQPPFKLPGVSNLNDSTESKKISCYGIEEAVLIYRREKLASGQTIMGPALILEAVSTTLIEPGWSCVVDDWGNLLLSRKVN